MNDQLKATEDLSGCRDKVSMSRHQELPIEICKGIDWCRDIMND